ncbi:hypothetical protein FACS1894185_3180 [Betaproteobacteria bacterium]|nr:hypothetical protein FACS1894185_3180 [Betaproteobacteria bacterium]
MALLGVVTSQTVFLWLALAAGLALFYSWHWGYAKFVREDFQTICNWWRTRKPAANDLSYWKKDAA